MIAIYKRELKSYFTSMIGPIFIAVLLFFIGIYFARYNLISGSPYFSYTLVSSILIYTIIIPILTMRSMADERKTKTDQMLITSPVSVTGIVLGKYFAMVTVLAIPVLICCICPLIILSFGNGYPVSDYATILLFFILGCAYIAIGMFISSLTESQIIATVISFAALFLLYMINGLSNMYPSSMAASIIGFVIILILVGALVYYLTKNVFVTAAVLVVGAVVIAAVSILAPTVMEGAIPKILSALSPSQALRGSAYYSMFTLKGLIYYLSIAVFFCFLTCQSIQKRRWS